MGNKCFSKKSNIFVKKQLKDEYYYKKVNIYDIGNYKPYKVFIGEDNIINNTILGLNSLCDCDIHISIGNNPNRIILSYVDITKNKKGETSHIYKIEYKKITSIDDITQYDIYNSIQDYIYKNNQIPKNESLSLVAI